MLSCTTRAWALAGDDTFEAESHTAGQAMPALPPVGRPSSQRPPGRAASRMAWSLSHEHSSESSGNGPIVGDAILEASAGCDSSALENEGECSEIGVEQNMGTAQEYEDAVFSTDQAAARVFAPAVLAGPVPLNPRRLRMPPPKVRKGWAEQHPKSRFVNGRLARASKLMRVQLRALEESA